MMRYTLAAGLAVLMNAAPAPGGDCKVLRLLGETDFDLSTGATTQRRAPSLAYNVRDRDYMVAWFDLRNPGNNDIFGQRVALDGSPIGDNIAIMEFAAAQVDPCLVHNSTFNGYLCVWRTQQAGFFNKARGILLDSTGMPDGDDFFVGEGLECAVAFNEKDQEYMQTGRLSGIRGQRVAIDGTLEGGSIIIATSGAPAPNGDVVYGCNTNRFVTTWRDQVDRNLKGRQFTASGSPFGAVFTVSDLYPEAGRASTIGYDLFNDRYFMVFGVFQENRILGQFMTTSGTRDGDPITIADDLTSRPSPVIAWVFGYYVVAWVDNGNAVAQLITDEGTLCGEPLIIAAGTASTGISIDAANSVDGLVVTWVDNRNLGDGQQDIYARAIGLADTCDGDVDESGTVDFDDLLLVLNAWGPYGDCPPYIAADINEDCLVGFDDLLIVLAAWGTCK